MLYADNHVYMYVMDYPACCSGSLPKCGGLPDSSPGGAHQEPGTFSTAESAAHTGRGAGRGREEVFGYTYMHVDASLASCTNDQHLLLLSPPPPPPEPFPFFSPFSNSPSPSPSPFLLPSFSSSLSLSLSLSPPSASCSERGEGYDFAAGGIPLHPASGECEEGGRAEGEQGAT